MNGFLKEAEVEVRSKIQLNEYQQKIADFKEGNMLVVANSGSGKTATLLERTANLVRGGVPPEKILILTFSKKAVEDLKERIDDNLEKVNIYTYHSLCYQTLMKSGLKVNLIKEWQVEAFFDKKVEQMGIDSYKSITSWIGYQKAYNRLPNSDNFVDTGTDLPVRVLALMYRDYEAYKKSKNLIDFDDMLVEFVKLIKKDNNVINVLHNMFHYIMVDEHQDTNEIQNEILSLLSAKGNLVAVGDPKQCVTPDTLIETKDKGLVEIKKIQEGDMVRCASGRGDTVFGLVEDVVPTNISKDIVTLITESGCVVKGTTEHIFFVNQKIVGKFFVYLMYREELGFRIGVSSNTRKSFLGREQNRNGYYGRMIDEGADAVWLLKVCDNKQDCLDYEAEYTSKYEILKYQFRERQDGKKQDEIDELFKNHRKTISEMKVFFDDFGLSFESPHYIKEVQSRNVSFIMFGENRKAKGTYRSDGYLGNLHEMFSNTTNEEFASILSKYGNVKTKKNGRGREYKALRKNSTNQDKIMSTIKEISENESDINVKLMARLTKSDMRYDFVPLGNIREGMKVCILKNNEIVEDVVVRVERSHYTGKVYDLNIKQYRNFIADGIVVHNCIYGFRGSQYGIMERFEKDWKSSTVLSLPINYRSTQGIVDISNRFVTRSFGTGDMYQDSICHTKRKSIIEVKPYTDVVGTVKRLHDKGIAYKDIAVLYRTSMQGGEFEFDLKSEGIPCVALEGNSFTSRKSVKTMLGYLKLAINTEDSEAFNDIYNTPNRYLSKDFRDRVLHSHESDLLENVGVCKTPYERTNYLTLVKNIEKVQDYVNSNKSVFEILTLIDRLFGVSKMLNKDSDVLDEKVKDIEVLKKIGSRCSTVKQYLFMIDNVDKMTKDNTPKDAVLLMTVHKSKGLEFKHVIVAGVDVDVFPHQRSTDDEERRLFYVAITRAIEGLYVQGTSRYVADLTDIIINGEVDLNNITTLDDWTKK